MCVCGNKTKKREESVFQLFFSTMKNLLSLLLLLFLSTATVAVYINNSIIVLPEGALSTGTSHTCPVSVTCTGCTCYNTIFEALDAASNGSTVDLIGESYTIESDIGDDSYIYLSKSVTLLSTVGTTILFSGTTTNAIYGLRITANNVFITGITFTTDRTSLSALVNIEFDNTTRLSSNAYFYENSVASSMVFNSTGDFIAMLSGISSTSCFCGCGLVDAPANILSNITITGCTFTGQVTVASILATETITTFGLTNITISENTIINPSDTIYHIFLDVDYTSSVDTRFNHYGPCIYPRVCIDGECALIDAYLPYYIDTALTHLAPLVPYDNATAVSYQTFEAAITASVKKVYLRGHMYMTEQLMINTAVFEIDAATDSTCCATIHVAASLNPAFYVIYETLTIKGVKLSMGAGSGAVLMRNAGAMDQANYLYITGGIYTDSLISSDEIARLDQDISPGVMPSSGDIKSTLFDTVMITSESAGVPYNYALLSFSMSAGTFPNLYVVNSVIEGADVAIANKHVGLKVFNTFMNNPTTSIASNTTFTLKNSQIVLPYSYSIGLKGTTGNTATDNAFYHIDEASTVASPSNIITLSAATGGNLDLHTTTGTYSTYTLIKTDTTVADSPVVLGAPGADNKVTITVASSSCATADIRAAFYPDYTPSGASGKRVVAAGIFSVYSIYGSTNLDINRHIEDIGTTNSCPELILYKSRMVAGVMSWIIPSLTLPKPTKICGSIDFTLSSNTAGASYLIANGFNLTTLCSTYTDQQVLDDGTGSILNSLEDAIFYAADGAIINVCSNGTFVLPECQVIDKSLTIKGASALTANLPTISCVGAGTCCCIFDLIEGSDDTTIQNLKLLESNSSNVGYDTCCYPAAIHIAAERSGGVHSETSYTGDDMISNIRVDTLTVDGFKHGIRTRRAYDITIYNTVFKGSSASMVLLQSVTQKVATMHAVWNQSLIGGYTFDVTDNTVEGAYVGITNRDLYETAPTPLCRVTAEDTMKQRISGNYIPPWNIFQNTFIDTDTGIIIGGVSSFVGYNLTVDTNDFQRVAQNILPIDPPTWMPPPFGTDATDALVVEVDGIHITNNAFEEGHHVSVFGSKVEVYDNDFTDANLIIERNSAKMWANRVPTMLPSDIIISGNDFCHGDKSSVVVDTILQTNVIHQNLEIGSYGYYTTRFADNKIATLYNVYFARDREGYPLNFMSTGTLNCANVGLDPNRTANEYILPPADVGDLFDTTFEALAQSDAFTGLETETIGTCEDGTQTAPDMKSCQDCYIVSSPNDAVFALYQVKLSGLGCIYFNLSAGGNVTVLNGGGTGTTVVEGDDDSSFSLAWWHILLIVGGVIGAVIGFVCVMYCCFASGDKDGETAQPLLQDDDDSDSSADIPTRVENSNRNKGGFTTAAGSHMRNNKIYPDSDTDNNAYKFG
jgi:hypothetical protein